MALKLAPNTVVISRLEDFPTPVAGVITLVNNVDYLINGTVNIGTNRIQLGAFNGIIGITKSDNILVYTGSTVMITGSGVNFVTHTLTITANTVGASVFSLTGAANSIEVRNCIFDGCQSLGSFTGLNSAVFTTNRTINSTNGLTVNSVSQFFTFSDNRSDTNLGAFTALTIGATVFNVIFITNNTFNPTVGLTSLNINVGSTVTKGVLANNLFVGVGTYLTGITYAKTGWGFINNIGIANKLGELFIPNSVIGGLALTVPNTNAAVLQFISNTGARFVLFNGTGALNGAAFTMSVPQDYFSGGIFILNSTSDTAAGNIKMFMGLTKVPLSSNFATLGETGLNTVFASTTAFNRISPVITPITSVFAAQDTYICKIWRDPGDAADTSTGTFYINNITFTYNAK